MSFNIYEYLGIHFKHPRRTEIIPFRKIILLTNIINERNVHKSSHSQNTQVYRVQCTYTCYTYV